MTKIANSKEAVVRFNGQQYYDDVKITERDKQILRDMFVVEEVLKSGPDAEAEFCETTLGKPLSQIQPLASCHRLSQFLKRRGAKARLLPSCSAGCR
ncbi:hypothetical protein PVT71_28590 (plasmid) [Salipiger sp. H15]|uniref:Uncharacterized protein n=1 Tax=Alloyangia sp. H15 TaxID=3029062 RepID=A0AAU8ATC9_9RHOB